MGLFTRNTMSLEQWAELFTWLYFCHADAYLKHAYWLAAEDRTKLCNLWLERNGHKANFWWLSEICLEAEKFAMLLVVGSDDPVQLQTMVGVLARHFQGEPLTPNDAHGVRSLLANGRSTLIASGLN